MKRNTRDCNFFNITRKTYDRLLRVQLLTLLNEMSELVFRTPGRETTLVEINVSMEYDIKD